MIHYDRIILNLRRAGLTSQQIARRLLIENERYGSKPIKVSKRAVDSWVDGKRAPVDFHVVNHLLDLHHDLCPQRHRVEVIGAP